MVIPFLIRFLTHFGLVIIYRGIYHYRDNLLLIVEILVFPLLHRSINKNYYEYEHIPYSRKVLVGENVGKFTLMSIWQGKIQIIVAK